MLYKVVNHGNIITVRNDENEIVFQFHITGKGADCYIWKGKLTLLSDRIVSLNDYGNALEFNINNTTETVKE